MAFGDAGKIRAMREPLYRAHFDTNGCLVSALANGCPVFRAYGDSRLQTAAVLNGWLQPGANRLLMLVEPPPGVTALAAGDSVFLRGKVTAADMAQPRDTRPEIMLAEFELDLAQDSGAYPLPLEAKFDVPTAFPQWTWLRAPALRIDDVFKQEAVKLVERVRETLGKKDLDAALSLQSVRNREMAQAMFQKPDERVADVRNDLQRLTKDGTASLRPLKPEEFQYSLFSEKRLARVEDAHGASVIRFDFPETNIYAAVPIFLARGEKGALAWVR